MDSMKIWMHLLIYQFSMDQHLEILSDAFTSAATAVVGLLTKDSEDEWLDKDEIVQLPKPVECALYIDI